jgi:hypothetical protein
MPSKHEHPTSPRTALLAALTITALAAAAIIPPGAIAAVIEVTQPTDAALRAAVDQAQPGDTVTFAPSLAGATILLGSELVLDQDVTITGADAPDLAISGNQEVRVFRVLYGATAIIEHLTLRDGVGFLGGAVYNSGDLTLRHCLVTASTAVTGGSTIGGGVVNGSGGDGPAILRLEDCTVTGNSSASEGGGVGNVTYGSHPAILEITGGEISGNTANFGGGLAAYAQFQGVAITRLQGVTITGNTASILGGGIHTDAINGGQQVFLELTDVVIEANTCESAGGGLAISAPGATVSAESTTLAGNSAPSGPDVSQTDVGNSIAFLGDCVVADAQGLTRYATTASDQIGGGVTAVGDDPDALDPTARTPDARPELSVAPNPFNPRTTVQFALPASGVARLEVIDVRGRVVARPWQGAVRAGEPVTVRWDGTDTADRAAASGVYLFRVTGPGGTAVVQRGTLVR